MMQFTLKHASIVALLLATACMSPSFGAQVKLRLVQQAVANAPRIPHRHLLQADTITSVGGSIESVGESPEAMATAAAAATAATITITPITAYAPSAVDASVAEPILETKPSSADPATAAGAGAGRRRSIVVPVPGDGYGAAQAVTPALTTQVVVYEYGNYAGHACVFGVGNFTTLRPEFNDMIGSIRIPAGLKVTLWENPNYTGRGLSITGPVDMPDLAPWKFHDITSSIRVESIGSVPTYATELLDLVNMARSSNDSNPVSLSAQLNAAAMAHSQDQASRQTMTHTGSDGSSFGTRITKAGYTWRVAAEELAVGYTSAQSVFNAWMNSADSYDSMQVTDMTHMGVAFATGGNGLQYWTLLLAAGR